MGFKIVKTQLEVLYCLPAIHVCISEIIKMSLPHADLAFLSACQTATGAEALPEEVVHSAAEMPGAGYRGVIATMWSIMDRGAPRIADDVYAHLLKDTKRDHTRAASALHLAVQDICADHREKSFLSRVPIRA
jgi:CHAT domain-containing protein